MIVSNQDVLCALSSLISKKGELISGAGKGSPLAQGHQELTSSRDVINHDIHGDFAGLAKSSRSLCPVEAQNGLGWTAP